MQRLRLERIAIRALLLGCLGFDHLQLVYEPAALPQSLQDAWYVLEAVRDLTPAGPVLGMIGADGYTTLARANAASGTALTRRLGTPAQRASTVLASGPDATALWLAMTARAAEIERQRLPYVAFAMPGSPLPTLNSSSVVATLLHDNGYDVVSVLPSSGRPMPGLET